MHSLKKIVLVWKAYVQCNVGRNILNPIPKAIVAGGVMNKSHASVNGVGEFLGDEPEPGS